jgi:transcription termination/antitermination protein NusG
MARLDRGDAVRIVDGLCRGFQGTVQHIDHQTGRIRVAIAVFGRQTVLRLGAAQVERR